MIVDCDQGISKKRMKKYINTGLCEELQSKIKSISHWTFYTEIPFTLRTESYYDVQFYVPQSHKKGMILSHRH